jgi:hypothetical protein
MIGHWCASFLALGNQKQRRWGIGFFLFFVHDRQEDLTDMFEKRAHGRGEMKQPPPTSVSRGISTPNTTGFFHSCRLTLAREH